VLKQQKEITMTISKQQKAAFQSYLRSCIGAVLAVVATGSYMPEDLLESFASCCFATIGSLGKPQGPCFR
jgi:hypothetical protein